MPKLKIVMLEAPKRKFGLLPILFTRKTKQKTLLNNWMQLRIKAVYLSFGSKGSMICPANEISVLLPRNCLITTMSNPINHALFLFSVYPSSFS